MKRTFPSSEIENHVAEARKRRGCSVSDLAASIGVSRQAIYAIEAGTYVPNTALTLRIAQALEMPVDDLFRLKDKQKGPASNSAKADLIAGSADVCEGQPIQLGRVDGRLIAAVPSPREWYLPAIDATAESDPVAGRINVHMPNAYVDFDNRLIIAGCDPAASILARHLEACGARAILVHRNSSESLGLLKKRQVHVAGTHLWHASTGETNTGATAGHFRRGGIVVISFAQWQEGLIVERGNPKRIKTAEDLTRKNIRFLNREQGAGTRLLLDAALANLGMKANQIGGYRDEAPGHLAAAVQVKSGAADCCIAMEACARALGLSFVPLDTARYDFIVGRQDFETPSVRILLDVLNSGTFRRELAACAGYDTSISGARLV